MNVVLYDVDPNPAVTAYDGPFAFAERTPARGVGAAGGWRRQRLSGHSSFCRRKETVSEVNGKWRAPGSRRNSSARGSLADAVSADTCGWCQML